MTFMASTWTPAGIPAGHGETGAGGWSAPGNSEASDLFLFARVSNMSPCFPTSFGLDAIITATSTATPTQPTNKRRNLRSLSFRDESVPVFCGSAIDGRFVCACCNCGVLSKSAAMGGAAVDFPQLGHKTTLEGTWAPQELQYVDAALG